MFLSFDSVAFSAFGVFCSQCDRLAQPRECGYKRGRSYMKDALAEKRLWEKHLRSLPGLFSLCAFVISCPGFARATFSY